MVGKIGFVGAGNMGSGMIANLAKAGYEVTVYDEDQDRAAACGAAGVTVADSLAVISQTVETIVLCLPHPLASKQVLNELLAASPKCTLVIETSTLTPEDAQLMGKTLASHGVQYVGAPMLGGKQAAESKQIQFLVECESADFELAKPILEAMGNRVDYMGQAPIATLAKLAFNICRYANVATATQVAQLVAAYTDKPDAIYEVLKQGSKDNFGKVWEEDARDMMLAGIPYVPTAIPEKDLGLVIDIAKQHGLPTDLYNSLVQIYVSMRPKI